MTEETFVASDLSADSEKMSRDLDGGTVSVSNSSITEIDLTQAFSKRVYTFSGGSVSLRGEILLSADIVRGTMECDSSSHFVLSLYTGSITAGDTTAQSGLITITGDCSSFSSDIHLVSDQEITSREGTQCSFSIAQASLFLSQNAGDYQKYSVQMELLEYASDILRDRSTPTFEFDVDSGNFLFANEFLQFRQSICLGNACYLKLQNGEVIHPILIEMKLNFNNWDKFSLGFSNRFKRHDAVSNLQEMIKASYSSSRNFDASQYIYNQASSFVPQITKFMESSLDAAVNTIIGAEN